MPSTQLSLQHPPPTAFLSSPTSTSHFSLPSFSGLNLPTLPSASSLVSVVSTPGRRIYAATKGGVSGNKKTVGRINLSSPLPLAPNDALPSSSSVSSSPSPPRSTPTPSFSSPPISASPILTSLHLPITSTDFYITGHADSSLTIYNTLTGAGIVLPLRGVYRGVTNLSYTVTHTHSPILLGSAGDGSIFYLPFWGLESLASDMLSCYVGGLCTALCGYRSGLVAVCDGILHYVTRQHIKGKFTLTSSPYPLPHATPVSSIYVDGVDEVIVGYKNGRVEWGGEGMGWNVVREGGRDGEEVKQVLEAGDGVLALTNTTLSYFTLPTHNTQSTQISLIPVPACSCVTLVSGQPGGREAKLDRWALEGGVEAKILGGGFVRGPQEVGIWDYVAALPSPPSESALPTPPQGGAIQSEEVERLKRLLKEKESECERWGDVNRKLVKRLKKSSS